MLHMIYLMAFMTLYDDAKKKRRDSLSSCHYFILPQPLLCLFTENFQHCIIIEIIKCSFAIKKNFTHILAATRKREVMHNEEIVNETTISGENQKQF